MICVNQLPFFVSLFIQFKFIEESMNSSKSNFLDRFNGKIGFITKHGQLISKPQATESMPRKLLTQNLSSMNKSKITKTFKENQQINTVEKPERFTLSRTLQRGQAQSLYSKCKLRLCSQTQSQKLNVYQKRSTAKENLMTAGSNLLQANFIKTPGRSLGPIKYNSLSWQIKDKQTNDFYNELTNLQMSKISSFSQNPKIHL